MNQRGGSKKRYSTAELTAHKTNYMMNKAWYCPICNNNINYNNDDINLVKGSQSDPTH